MLRRIVWGGLLAMMSSWAMADVVTPTDQVTKYVIVRSAPSTSSGTPRGRLNPGDRAELLESIPSWYRVRLSDGTRGYVSKRWTVLIPDAAPTPGAPAVQGIPFDLYVIDVVTGDGLVIDMGDKEIVIDGGMHTGFEKYIEAKGLIQDPIELAIVTHGDADHWKGLQHLLNLDDAEPSHQVLEFWEPGYDRDCNPLASYTEFIEQMRALVPAAGFKRPLNQFIQPAVETSQVTPFMRPSLPGVTFTLLSADSDPEHEAENNDCAYHINNASIVLMLEIGGTRLLLTGDANGKERDAPADHAGHVEAKLLALEQSHPGTLRTDILKVPHHGSETASSDAFLVAVRPDIALISASKGNAWFLPKESAVDRYSARGISVQRTDADRRSCPELPAGPERKACFDASELRHIHCKGDGSGLTQCVYE